jgi:adenylate kinase family enzyme
MNAQVQPISLATSGVEGAARRFRLLAHRRAAWLRWLARENQASVVDEIIENRDAPEAEAAWTLQQPWAARWRDELSALESDLLTDTSSPLGRARRVFGLSQEEVNLLEACTAVAMDGGLARLCAYLQDNPRRSYVTGELAARLYELRRCSQCSTDSALFRWELVHEQQAGPGEPPALSLDAQMRDWFGGVASLPELLAGAVRLHHPVEYLGRLPVSELASFVDRQINGDSPRRVRLVIEGAPGSGRRTLAGAISARLRLPLLLIDADEIEDRDWRLAYLLAQRQAFMEGAALAWHGEGLGRRPWPGTLPPFPVQFAIVESSCELAPVTDVVERRVRTPALSVEERAALWHRHLPDSNAWPAEEFQALAERYRVYPGDIVAAAASGSSTAEDATQRVRAASRGRLGRLAQLLPCSFTWDDLVTTAALRDSLEDLVFEASHRVAFWEGAEARRLFPQGQGLVALFSGPPGTGKTMAAQVIAATLGYDLFRVDLAGVVSKWVGETSQNFERILSRAADMNAIVFFDECDAIFSKRTSEVRDAQDKFANTDAAYLLQAIESYPGIALLATNQQGNIDPVFIRRLRYLLEFSRPDAGQRLAIWRKAVSGLAGKQRCEALDSVLLLLAESVEATGAQIKYAALGSVFAAQRDGAPVQLRHLLRGLEREMAKEGRALGARERERLLSHER